MTAIVYNNNVQQESPSENEQLSVTIGKEHQQQPNIIENLSKENEVISIKSEQQQIDIKQEQQKFGASEIGTNKYYKTPKKKHNSYNIF